MTISFVVTWFANTFKLSVLDGRENETAALLKYFRYQELCYGCNTVEKRRQRDRGRSKLAATHAEPNFEVTRSLFEKGIAWASIWHHKMLDPTPTKLT